MTNTSTQIIIIGGGHNGLVCATYLAKAGHSVQVIEARDSVGGSAANYAFSEGYQVSVAHLLHSLNPKVCKDLNLHGAGLKIGKAVNTISLDLEGNHLTLSEGSVAGTQLSGDDIEAYKVFKKDFQSYAKALDPLTMNKPPRLKDMDNRDKLTLGKLAWKLRFGLGADAMREFLRVGGINIYDVLNEVIDSPALKGAIAADAVIGHHMGPRTPNTVLTYLNRVRGENYSQLTMPAGGMGQVTQALAAAAEKAGVVIRTSTKVKRVIVNDGTATGVELESGETLNAATVVSNADAKTTFLNLVGAANLDAMFVQRVSQIRSKGNVAKLHFALQELPNIKGLSKDSLGHRLLIAPDMRYVEHAFNHSKYGEYSEKPVLEITIPSLNDSTLAPSGHHLMSVSASFAPYQLKQGWEEARSLFSETVIKIIEQYAPGFSSTIVDQELLTPMDIESQFNVEGGHWHHGELALDQSFMMRPVHGSAQYDTPIDGLFLCGAAAHPGGGVTAIPGHNAAQRILSMMGA